MKRILVGTPSYNAHRHDDTNDRLQQCTKLHRAVILPKAGSFLIGVFNELWCAALNGYKRGHFDYFAMLHADVIPDPWWLDKLVSLIETHKADVVTTVIPLKEYTGKTSTGLGGDDPWDVKRCLTLKECRKLPPTFTAKDCGHDGPLLINTGCWIADLSKNWTKEFSFSVESRIVLKNGDYVTESSRTEDWNLGRFLHAKGCKVMATREIVAYHFGNAYFGNNGDYGLEVDPNAKL